MHQQLKDLRLAVANITRALDNIEASLSASTTLLRHSDCVSPVPKGYDTVLGYLAKYHPDVLDTFDHADPSATQRDGYWLKHRAREQGLAVWMVTAPPILQAAGITVVNSYPLELLAQRWG